MSGSDSQVSLQMGRAPQVFAAWCLLVLVDVVLRAFGFNRLYRLVQGWPTVGAIAVEKRLEKGRLVCGIINRARSFYIRRAWCLQSAAAAVCLLRLRGVPSQLVIGVRQLPFYAHAWVDIDGEVVLNDRPELKELFQEIARC